MATIIDATASDASLFLVGEDTIMAAQQAAIALAAATTAQNAADSASASAASVSFEVFPDRNYSSGIVDANGKPILAVPASGGPAVGSAAPKSPFLLVFPDRQYRAGIVDANGSPISAIPTSGGDAVGSAAPKSPFLETFPDRPYRSGGRVDANGRPLSAVPVGRSEPVGSEVIPSLSVLEVFPDRPGVYPGMVVDANLRPISGVPDTTRAFVDTDGIYLDNGTADIRIAAPVGTIISEGNPVAGILRWHDKQGAVRERRQAMLKPWSPGSYNRLMINPALGQSLDIGFNGRAIYTTSPIIPGRALMANGGARPVLGGNGGYTWNATNTGGTGDLNNVLTDDRILYLTDLMEQYIIPKPGTVFGGYGETQMSGEAYWLGKPGNVEATTAFVSGTTAIGGATIAQISKGTQPYANMIRWTERMVAYARMMGMAPEIVGLDFDQGESDPANPAWQAALLQLQSDASADFQAIMGDAVVRPLICWQPSSWTKFGQSTAPVAALALINAAIAHPDLIRMVGPQYWSAYYDPADGVHQVSRGYRQFGEVRGREKMAVRNGQASQALFATGVTYSGSTLTITMSKPVVIDTTLVSDPGQYGLDLLAADGVTNIPLSSIAVSGSTITAVPATAPSAGAKCGIARLGTLNALAGPTTGMRSCFRDTTTDMAGDGTTHLYNWACHQQIALN